MASFDYFSQMQGPVVNTSLFSDAATQGIAAGKNLPTKTTALIQGIQQGLDRGVQDIKNINEVTQIPVQNQLRQEQLENAQIVNDINSIKLGIAKETEAEQLNATREELLNTASDLSRKRELREKEKSLQQQLASADPLTQKKIINSGQFNDVFANNPNVYKQAITPIYPYLSKEEQHAADFNLKRASTSSYYDKEAEKRATLFSNARQGVLDHDSFKEAARNSKLTPYQVAEKGSFVPSGKYETDPDSGNVIIDDKTKQPKVSPLFDTTVVPQTYDIVIGDPKTGRSKVVARGADANAKKLKDNYVNERNWQEGTYKQRALNQINEEALSSDPARQQSQQAPVTAPAIAQKAEQTTVAPNPQAVAQIQSVPVVDQTKKINVGNNPVAINNIAGILGLPPAVTPEAAPKIQEFLKLTEEAPEGYFGRFSGDQISKKEQVINGLSIYTAQKEFELNDMEKAGYNEEAVKAHNKLVTEVLNNKFMYEGRLGIKPSSASDSGIEAKIRTDRLPGNFAVMPSPNLSVSDLVVVGTPKDLYTLKRKGYYQSQLQLAYKKYRDKIELTKQALLKAGTRGSRLSEVLNQAS